MHRVILLHFVVVTVVLANPVVQNEVPKVEAAARAMGKDCAGGIFSATCLKIEAISMLEKLNSKEEVQLLPGLSLAKEPSKDNESKADEFAAELARSLPSSPDERLDKYLLYRLGSYLDTHSVKFKLIDNKVTEQARALIGEARKDGGMGGGKKGGMGGLMMMAAMMKGTLMAIGMGGLAMLAGKAMMTAMMSLVLSAVIGLKSLSSGKGSTTYEVIAAKPHDEGYGHGYRRNLNVRRR